MVYIIQTNLSLVAEITVIALMLIASAIITKQQSDIPSSVFNFVGLLLILDLDELAVKTTSFTSKTLYFKNRPQKIDKHVEKTKILTSICFFIGLVIYMLI